MKIFLSYASEDREIAEQIQLALVGAGWDVFFDRAHLPPGGDYHARIRQAVCNSDLFLFLISTHSIAKGSYCLTELGYARDRWPHPKGRVIPVALEPTPFPTIPTYLRAVTIFEPEGNIPAEVLSAVGHTTAASPWKRWRKWLPVLGLPVLLTMAWWLTNQGYLYTPGPKIPPPPTSKNTAETTRASITQANQFKLPLDLEFRLQTMMTTLSRQANGVVDDTDSEADVTTTLQDFFRRLQAHQAIIPEPLYSTLHAHGLLVKEFAASPDPSTAKRLTAWHLELTAQFHNQFRHLFQSATLPPALQEALKMEQHKAILDLHQQLEVSLSYLQRQTSKGLRLQGDFKPLTEFYVLLGANQSLIGEPIHTTLGSMGDILLKMAKAGDASAANDLRHRYRDLQLQLQRQLQQAFPTTPPAS